MAAEALKADAKDLKDDAKAIVVGVKDEVKSAVGA